jgi:hemoglobin
MPRSTYWTGLALLIALTPAVRAQDTPPPAQADLEARIIRSLADAINTGVPLFNPPKNDAAGCYHVYQGAIKAVLPLLDHRPDLQKSVQDKLQKAESQTAANDQAFTLRSALDEIRLTLHKDQAKPASTTRSLWDRLGGATAIKEVVHEFVVKAYGDEKVNFTRGKFPLDDVAIARLEQSLMDFISQNTGGLRKYEGKDMAEAHKGMAITEDEFNALADDLKEILKKHDVPQKEMDELMAIVASTKSSIVGK